MTLVDFGANTTVVSGTNARLLVDEKALLWAGDANFSDQAIANGPDNDTNAILGTVLLSSANTSLNANHIKPGYEQSDLNMDGDSIFAGPNNDVNLLIGNVLLHPNNGTLSANYVIKGTLPR